jgi:hypothetical protein
MVDGKEVLQESKTINDIRETKERDHGLTDLQETIGRIPPEVKSWMQKMEEDPGTMKTVNDSAGQPLLTPSAPQNPKVVLPITRTKFIAGFKKTIDEAGRWLSTFILRLVKIKKGKVKFKEE